MRLRLSCLCWRWPAECVVPSGSQLILPQLSVLGFADSEFTDRRAERAEAELVWQLPRPR